MSACSHVYGRATPTGPCHSGPAPAALDGHTVSFCGIPLLPGSLADAPLPGLDRCRSCERTEGMWQTIGPLARGTIALPREARHAG